jgi:hypothetical protein
MDARTVFEPDEVQAMSHRSVEDNSSQHHHAVNNNSILDSNSLHPDASRGYVNNNRLPDVMSTSSQGDNSTANSSNNSRDNISNIIISRPNDDDQGLNSHFDNVSNDSNANRSRDAFNNDSFVLSNNISRSYDSNAAGDGTSTTPQVLLYASNTSSNNESESSSNPVNASTRESSNPDRRSNINISINGIVVESMSGDNNGSSNNSNDHENVTSNNSSEVLTSGSDNDSALQEDAINSNSSISAEDTSREEETAVSAVGLFGQRNLVSDDFSSPVGGLFSGKRHQVFFLFTAHLTIYQSTLLLR